jgi:hypothetical protein
VAAMIKDLDEVCKAEGRDRSTIEISTMWVPAVEAAAEAIPRYEEIGVSRLIVPLQFLGEGNPIDHLKKLADDVVSKQR